MKISFSSFLHFQVTHETEIAEENTGAIKFRPHRTCTATLATYYRRSTYIPYNKLYFYCRQESTSCFHFFREPALLYLLQSPNERIIDKSVYECARHRRIKFLTELNYLIREEKISQNEVHRFKNLQQHVTVEKISIYRQYKMKNYRVRWLKVQRSIHIPGIRQVRESVQQRL
jgi:hypothetical protein